MKFFRTSLLLIVVFAIAGCAKDATTGKTVVNPTLLQDGQLIVAGLQVASADAATLGAPPNDVTQINTTLATMQKAVTDLQAGSTTPQDFATVATDTINGLAPVILNDAHANQTIKTSMQLMVNMIPLIVADVTTAQKAPTAQQIDRRGALGGWVYQRQQSRQLH